MPLYDLYCDSCKKTTEVFHCFGEDDPTECPQCNAGGTLKKVLFPPTIIDATPKTLGTLAEKNSRAQYWLDTQRMKHQEERERSREALAESLPPGASLVDTTPEKAWWRPEDKPNLKLTQLTPQQQYNYAMTGNSEGDAPVEIRTTERGD